MPNNNIHIVPISQEGYATLCSSNNIDNNTFYTIKYKKINDLENEVRMLKESITDLLNNQKFDD